MKMKKYLMTGIAALALCVGFTSCSHDLESLSQEEIDQLEAQKIVDNYNKAFKAYIGGEIAPTQAWGFGSLTGTRTRVNYANSNHWGAPADQYNEQTGWIVPDTLSNGQRLRVARYFQSHPYLTYVDPHWENFFVQQVYTGGDDVLKSDTYSKEISESYSPEVYRSGEKQSTEAADITSKNLNYLFAYGETEHIANFNGAKGTYKPVLETGEDINNGKKHDDRINLMYQSSTQDFSYQCSYASIRHGQPYVALVSAKTIDDWADSLKTATGIGIGDPVYYGYSYSGKENKYWNRSFLGCDLELLIGDDIYLNGYNDYSAPKYDGHWVDGYKYYKPETYGETYKYLISESNQFGGDLRKYDNEPTGDDLAWLLENGYLPVYNKADKEWVKPQAVADHFYSDWIVTLSKARRQGESDPETYKVRVMAEDLSATEASDFDFNDVVIDVYFTTDEDEATIILQAAGGTLPLRINGDDTNEVHSLFGVGTNVMVNTGWGGSNGASKNPVSFDIPFTLTDKDDNGVINEDDFLLTVKEIKLEVKKTLSSGAPGWFEMKAEKGEPASKFAIPLEDPTVVNWCPERTSIKDTYESFVDWAQTGAIEFKWW